MKPATVDIGYLDLNGLAAYSSCSVRWLRDRLVDRIRPLPHYRIGGKLLVKRDEFDSWMNGHQAGRPTTELNQIVDDIIAKVSQPRRVA